MVLVASGEGWGPGLLFHDLFDLVEADGGVAVAIDADVDAEEVRVVGEAAVAVPIELP